MATVGHHQASIRFFHCFRFPSPKLLHLRNSNSHKPAKVLFSTDISQKFRVSKSIYIRRDENLSFYCFCKSDAEFDLENVQEDNERPPFDINLAVILAGFAFEAYWSPPENVGRREVDAANCQTVFLSESFLREVYDGQLFIKLKKGVDFPAMDPWGTSDPYVVMQLDGQVVKSKVKWATKDPMWNEELTLNIRKSPAKNLQVAAWDANLVTPHKRMGYTSISVESFCDGNLHEVMVELEGMGGGGKIHLEVKYKSFDGIDEEKQWWRIPFISDFPWKKTFESALKQVVGSETVQPRQFVQYAFGHLKIFSDGYIEKSRPQIERSGKSENSVSVLNMSSQHEIDSEGYLDEKRCREDSDLWEDNDDNGGVDVENTSSGKRNVNGAVQSDKYFWKNFSNVINQNVVQKLGLPAPDKIKWDGFDLLSKIGLQSRQIAEAGYIESGLATAEGQVVNNATGDAPIDTTVQYALPDMKKTSWDMLRETDSILGALMVLAATFSQQKNEAHSLQENETEKDANTTLKDGISGYYTNERIDSYLDGSTLDERKAGEMKALFSTAESAMEAWALLATSLGHPSFIKSEFEKLCFLDNPSTDTQVAIWRDSARKRLVVAFRGTEQTRWKDLRTDLMLVPAGLNPERLGSDFKQEVQVHSGFLSAYDSVRTRIMSLIKLSIGFIDDVEEAAPKWHIYVTGHSLGGALATLLALELSSSQLAKCGTISVTMYNFGSPRVGNRRFAEIYNEKVKDSWRIVNHRDIIPTVPRLMGYCHVAQPVYLATGDLRNALENIELSGDGYQGDIIGESTPDVIVGEFMKGEKELIEKILNTEINIFRSIRDGSALMQHMEDFYYITLLENVRLNYDMADRSNSNGGTLSV